MPQETVGYVELEWTCVHCGTKNAGTKQTCVGCGAPMSDSQKFELPAQQTLISDKDVIAQAESGPDIICPYCGTRNTAGSTKCSHCSGELTGATAREKGDLLGAFQSAPQPDTKCRYCGTMNPATGRKCKTCGSALVAEPAPATPVPTAATPAKLGLIPIIIIACAIMACLGFFIMSSRTSDTVGVVNGLSWQRRINILALRPVQREDWKDRIPEGATIGSCREEVRRTQDQPTARSQKVCGTPYTVDQGTGVGKVMQDCQYNILDDVCKYSVNEWIIVDAIVAKGNDASPTWPAAQLDQSQRLGNREENYQVTFLANDKTYTYTPRNAEEYAQFAPGTKWALKVNALGGIADVSPAQ